MTMRHETAQIYLAVGADVAVVERELYAQAQALPGVRRVVLGRNLDGSWGAGDYTLDLHFVPEAAGSAAGLAGVSGVARIDRVVYRRQAGGLRAPGLQNGIWRTLLFRVRPQASEDQVAALERDLLRMPDYMPGIRNWQLCRVTSAGGWTHVWQQEFAGVDDLLGEYLAHPFHWGRVDRWFDPEFPEWTVEAISHAFCPLASSLLTFPNPTEESR
jgi:hypothetical protein